VTDASGKALSGVSVKGTWSGLTSSNSTVTTNSLGVASFASATTRNFGTFVFTVTGATRSSYQYDSALNVETSDSITR
jgi:hypothetical protein